MRQNKLFNPEADDSKRKLVGGETTNLFNIADIKYQDPIEFFLKAYSNNWLPQEVANMAEDKMTYTNVLTDDERRGYNLILSYLVFLDSVQTNNLPNISEFITSPEHKLWLARQDYDEAVHSFTYGYILSEMLTIEEANEIVYLWREDDILRERIAYIAELYDEYKDKDDKKSFLILIIANFMLEGLYFYNGFMFFHNMAYRGLMTASNTQIAYIKRDEMIHCSAFKEIALTFKEENPEAWDEDLIYNLFQEAVRQELKFGNHAIGDNILGMSKQTVEDYTYYLANLRLRQLSLDPIFPQRKNPYKHLDKYAAIDNEETNVTNNFEKKSIAYKNPVIYNGWGELVNRTDFKKDNIKPIWEQI